MYIVTIESYFKADCGILSVYLWNGYYRNFFYGFYARGDNDAYSDIDIVVVVKGNRIELQQKLKKVWDISADIGLENDVMVSLTVLLYDEFEEYKELLPYYRNILMEGKRIG